MKKNQTRNLRILIGGVPFGRNNIGDEAILEGMVRIIRNISPNSKLTVSTDDPINTAKKLNVDTCPLFGFSHVEYDVKDVRNELKNKDLYIWCGATGLSDYPEDALSMLDLCKSLKVPSIVFGTGMNKELNPTKYKIQSGKKRQLLNLVKSLSLGMVDPVSIIEKQLKAHTYKHIKKAFKNTELVVLRDSDSAKRVTDICDSSDINVGADPAILIPGNKAIYEKVDTKTNEMLQNHKKKIGICISAQRKVKQFDELTEKIDSWIDKYDAEIFFIPMNPVTDRELMKSMMSQMKNKQSCTVVENCLEPSDIVELTSHMDFVISSRLHLLILASNNAIPLIGISRGSKVDSFLSLYGFKSSGSVDELNLEHLEKQVEHFIGHGPEYISLGRKIREQMLKRLTAAISKLEDSLRKVSVNGVTYA